MKNVSGLETVYRDYKDQVRFFYVYKRLAHPVTNNFLEPATLQERLMHVAEAKRMTGTAIPWLADAMDDRMTKAFGGPYNGEFVIDPDGKIVRQRFWSNPLTLRADLVELIGSVDNPTRIEDLPVRFRPEPRRIASGVVPPIDLPRGLSPVEVKHVPPDDKPIFVKLRAELTQRSGRSGKRQLYLGFYVDPIHRIHWNNDAGPIEVELKASEDSGITSTVLQGPAVEESADVDPRMFLIDVGQASDTATSDPLTVLLRYVVCDDKETFCFPLEQVFEVHLRPLNNGSTRPGIFLNRMFRNMARFDRNEDGLITASELGKGNVTKFMTHMDYNLDNVIDQEELGRFYRMYDNGRGMK